MGLISFICFKQNFIKSIQILLIFEKKIIKIDRNSKSCLVSIHREQLDSAQQSEEYSLKNLESFKRTI